MYTCDSCKVTACGYAERENMPKNCPMHNQALMDDAFATYFEEENQPFFIASTEIEAEGYCEWPRVREVVEFAKKMGYQKLGIAFCIGLQSEANTVAKIFRAHGFEVVSVACKNGGISKEKVGVPEKGKLKPGQFESMCNPIAQARLLSEQQTEFNIVIGLCVGHDSLFYKYTDAFTTTLVTKDRVLAHNPAGAIYCSGSYFKAKLEP